MAEHGGPIADFAAVIDASQADAWTTWVFLLFVVGNLIGTLLFAIGLLRQPGRAGLGGAVASWPGRRCT